MGKLNGYQKDHVTRKQYEELCEALSFDKGAFRQLLNEYCGIEARPYTGFSFYDGAGNYIGDSNDCDVKSLLDSAYIRVVEEEAVHLGRWLPMKTYPEFVCSECGELWPDAKVDECPECHTKMETD